MMNTPPLTEGWSAPPVWRLCVLRASLSGIGFHTHRLKGLLFNLFCARQSARPSGAGASHTHTHTHFQPPPKSSRHHQETELTTAPTLRQNTAPAVCICHNDLGNNTHTHALSLRRDPRNDRRDWRASADCEVAFLRVSHLSHSQTVCLLTN